MSQTGAAEMRQTHVPAVCCTIRATKNGSVIQYIYKLTIKEVTWNCKKSCESDSAGKFICSLKAGSTINRMQIGLMRRLLKNDHAVRVVHRQNQWAANNRTSAHTSTIDVIMEFLLSCLFTFLNNWSLHITQSTYLWSSILNKQHVRK